MVVYFEVEGMPGKYFSCSRYGTMSPESCAKNHAAAPVEFRQRGRLEGCLGCKVGAQHAGKAEVVAEQAAPAMTYRPVCLRCRRSGRENTSRLVGRMRLVRGHSICVSCYNREREVLAGANAKGAPPKKWGGLFTPNVAYVRDSRTVMEKMKVPVIDRIEVALTLVRQLGASGVCWAGAPIVRLV